MSASPHRPYYHSAEIEWRDNRWIYSGYAEPRFVAAGVLAMARAGGWTVPRWWQFWRRGEKTYVELRRLAGEP